MPQKLAIGLTLANQMRSIQHGPIISIKTLCSRTKCAFVFGGDAKFAIDFLQNDNKNLIESTNNKYRGTK